MTTAATAHEMQAIDELLGKSADRYSAEDKDLFCRAWRFAGEAHRGQKRFSGEPYLTHCIETARLLAELRMDAHTVAAGLLHDVIEDTRRSRAELEAVFPAPIVDLIEGVTKISTLPFSTDRERQALSLRKMILAMARDVRVVIIKLCDRLHNMRTLQFLPESKQRQISQSTLDIYAPLANRLGMSRIRAELEDLSMYYLFPAAYAHMRMRVSRRKAERESIVQRSIDSLRDHFAEAGLHPEITGRPKHFYSIYQKMQRQNLTFEEIYDLIALRIICDTVRDCYEIVGRVHALWHPVPGRFKDYVALPKDNGYQSIHTTVIGLGGEVTEVQIRTQDMHKMAEEGIAAHWRYKEGAGDVVEEERLAWLRRLLDWLQDVENPNEFMDALKQDVFSDVVFCFTPKGHVVEMPVGSTALDFAYYIHTAVGESCGGVRINRKLAPLKTPLQMGDIVEIIRSRSAHPTPGWLDIAQTSRALSKIRHWLKTNNFDENRAKGLDMLTRALRAKGLDLPQAELATRLEPSFAAHKVSSYDELLAEIGFGSVSTASVVGRLEGEARRGETARRRPQPKKDEPAILVDGLQNMVVRLANCCKPITGDPIIGFVTRGRGVTAHRGNCPNLQRILLSSDNDSANRLVPVRWREGKQPLRQISFRIGCQDRQGLLSDISKVFSDAEANIVEVNTKSNLRNNQASLRFKIEARDADQINAIIKALEAVAGVERVSRVAHSP